MENTLFCPVNTLKGVERHNTIATSRQWIIIIIQFHVPLKKYVGKLACRD
jgi:hypothetical protein